MPNFVGLSYGEKIFNSDRPTRQ